MKPAQTPAEDFTAPKQLNPDRVRDHLANERTYLAWMRSAIALIGLGVVIVRLRILRPPTAPSGNGWKLGLLFSLIGLSTVLLSTQHYFSGRRKIEDNNYAPSDRWVAVFSTIVLLLGIGVLLYILSIPFDLPGDVVLE